MHRLHRRCRRGGGQTQAQSTDIDPMVAVLSQVAPLHPPQQHPTRGGKTVAMILALLPVVQESAKSPYNSVCERMCARMCAC